MFGLNDDMEDPRKTGILFRYRILYLHLYLVLFWNPRKIYKKEKKFYKLNTLSKLKLISEYNSKHVILKLKQSL